ncbi:MAG: hypothetical protein V3V78_00915 [Candidatus Woesearchaeota archaeon]
MKITIDTKDDSHEDIRKVIALLSKMIDESPMSSSNIFGESNSSSDEESEPATTNAFANMFGSSDSGAEEGMPVLEPTSANEDDEAEEEKDDGVQIVEY